MFGTNEARGPERGNGETLWVQEVFGTIQGEGPLSGQPAIFVRSSGCNLMCFFCDTDFESSTWHPSLNELMSRIELERAKVATRLIVLTGGEPMRQNIVPFLRLCLAAEWRVQIETAGTLWPTGLDAADMQQALGAGRILLVCSPKTGVVHKSVQKYCHDYKYIVSVEDTSPKDGLPMFSTQEKGRVAKIFRTADLTAQIWVQPCTTYKGSKQDFVTTHRNMQHAAAICMKHGYRLSLQTHRILGLP